MTWRQSTVRSRELGRRLLAAQEEAGLNTEYLRTKMRWLSSQWDRTMSGQRPISATDAATILGLCDVEPATRDAAVKLCEPNLDAPLHLPRMAAWSAYLAEVATASHLFEYQPRVMPWLVRTPDYTRAVLTPSVADSDVDQYLAARTEVTRALVEAQVEVVVHESALGVPVDNDRVMSEQLHHLVWLSEQPNITVHLLPGSHRLGQTQHGGFSLLRFAGHDPVVHREEHSTGILTNTRHDIQVYRSTANLLIAAAMPEQHSRRLIKSAMAELDRLN